MIAKLNGLKFLEVVKIIFKNYKSLLNDLKNATGSYYKKYY